MIWNESHGWNATQSYLLSLNAYKICISRPRWKENRRLFTLSFSCAYQFWCVFIVAFIFHEITLIILLQFGAINFISNWQRQLLRCVIMIKHNLSTWSSTINSRSPRFGDREMRWTRCGPNGLMEPLCAASIPIGVRVYLIGRRHTSHKMSHARLLLIWRGRCLRAYNSALEKLDERQNV